MGSNFSPQIILGPAKKTTVVTTTTTTTTTYAPITLPPLPPQPTLKDPKLYPLLHAPVPRSLRRFPLVFPGGTRAVFHDPGDSDEDTDPQWAGEDVIGGEGWQMMNSSSSNQKKDKEVVVGLNEAIDRFGVRKRVHNDPHSGDVVMEGIDDTARSPPPRKKARPSDQIVTRSHAAPPSPLPSPQPSPAGQVLWAPNPSTEAQAPSSRSAYTLHLTPPGLQSHYILTLLRHSPLQVLRMIHSVLTPTLARDFVGMLPPELASNILQFLPPSALFAAARVSRSWRNLVDSDPVIWMNLLKRTGTWFGGPSEVAFAQRVEEYRARHPPAFRRGSTVSSLPLPHPYKLLFRARHTILSRWTQTTPKRLHFPAHGASVVTCLLFSRRRIISASDDHSIHVYDPADGRQIRILEGHEGGVWALAVCSRRIVSRNPHASPKYYDLLVSGSTDRTVRIWDLATGRNTHVFGGHTSTVRCLAVVRPTWIEKDDGSGVKEKWPKRTLIVTGSRDHSLRVWRLPGRGEDEYRCFGADTTEDDPAEVGHYYYIEDVRENPYHIRLLEGHTHAVRALAAHGRTLVSGSYDATVRVWDIITGDCKFTLTGHTQKVYSVVLDSIRNQVCSGSMDGSVRIWSLKTGQLLHTLIGHTSLVGLLSLSPTTLVSAAADSTLRIWDPTSGSLQHVLSAHTGAITCFQHDEFKVLSGSDGALKMWDTRDGTVIRDLLTNITGVWQVVFDERFCVAASNAQEHTFLDVWDFGMEGDDDIEAARVGEEDEESEDEDDHEDEMMQDAASNNEEEVVSQQTWSAWEPGTSEDTQNSNAQFETYVGPSQTFAASPTLELPDPTSPSPVPGPSSSSKRGASSKDKGKGKAVATAPTAPPSHETPPASTTPQAMPPGGYSAWAHGAAPGAQSFTAAMAEETPSKSQRSTRQRR
ncbi:WD40-repeat-containing domain protein [Cantharellus anzutake]|uniref:WD40-repeat-containing domain protein n=1 Tax=Cantharellus anzutake TaxID=1750568 RepID=UPI0019039917|nr:WD40-repeat-containing domain protein [Cantharellus anzutake]KAF8323591.1 WD40-repeat-containing domain protein [Cantharellus anzutake]